ncbi:MAG: T9SS type A sorting domain-containing protein [Bacteroidetes bacterium]|nr:T9SS type A sorting domain-containing protein [Bacteroidota bacterium]MBL0079000.1 T9SS type A sorting domain-containing protein [Bacteroidota bacterium]
MVSYAACQERIALFPELDSVLMAQKFNSVSEPTIFPNPAYQFFTASIPDSYLGGKLCVYNELGEMIIAPTELIAQHTIIDVFKLPPGTYFIQITDSNKKATVKSIIKL